MKALKQAGEAVQQQVNELVGMLSKEDKVELLRHIRSKNPEIFNRLEAYVDGMDS